jgi:cytochrome c oxidase assembly protein subunit 15
MRRDIARISGKKSPEPPLSKETQKDHPFAMQLWLIACMAMVVVMVLVGGITRLTESGLSMVDWHPIHGILPPLDEAEWQEEFDNYRQFPEYQHVNKGMSLEAFKGIFWWEYIHRMLGRLVGLVFVLPLLFFAFTRTISKPLGWRMFGICLLVGLQGLMGWYMVQSGLADVPWVSPLRLMMHLGLAFLIFACVWWQYLHLHFSGNIRQEGGFSPATMLVTALLFMQILLGALVAGMDAGLLYDSFPTMNGAWVPEGWLALEPWYHNLVENPETVHFLHRAGALLVTAAILAVALPALVSSAAPYVRQSATMLLLLLVVQLALGAYTVIYHVPIILASLHQLVALFLFAAMLRLLYVQPFARKSVADKPPQLTEIIS